MRRCWWVAALVLLACGPRGGPDGAADPLANPSAAGDRPWPDRTVDGYDPRSAVALSTIAAHRWDGDDFGSPHFRDVMSHARPENRFAGDHPMSTIGHETHHMLLAQVASDANTDDAFFYFGGGFGAFVPDSQSRFERARVDADGRTIYRRHHDTGLRTVRDYVPDTARTLAATRFATYLMDDHNATAGVLHLFDEWNAYLAGGRMSIESHRAGHYDRAYPRTIGPSTTSRVDAVDGMVDFLWFASAGVLALSEREPDYMRRTPQLKAVYALLAEETVRLFAEGRTIATFRGFHGEALFDAFATAPDNQPVRELLRAWLGPAWTARVFGF